MFLPDATIELNLSGDHSKNLEEGETVMINVNAFKQLDGAHIRLGSAKVDNLPLIKSNTSHSLQFTVPDYIGTNTISLHNKEGTGISNKLEVVSAFKLIALS